MDPNGLRVQVKHSPQAELERGRGGRRSGIRRRKSRRKGRKA
jgi:hypothetical protein